MAAVFIKLLNMSIAAGWLILAVILLRVFLKNAPKWICCILWGLVAVRLICPYSIESICSLLPSAEAIPQDIMYADNPSIHTGIMAVNRVVNPYLSETMTPQAGNSINPMQVLVYIGTIIWVVGMVGMLIYVCISYIKIKKKVAVSLPVKENIYFCDYINMPFVLGVLRPRIYLPSALAEEEKADFVIAHEKAHISRRDHLWKPFGFLILTIYWFHPLIWVAYILLCRDIELACDEHVISGLQEHEKKIYSEALLACSLEASGYYRNMISACPLAFGEVCVKDRVKAVLYYKRPAFWLVVLGVLACILAAVCFLTDPKERSMNAPEPFGHSYRVEEVVYGDTRYSFVYTPDNAPRYQFTSDYGMLVSGDAFDSVEGEEWVQQYGSVEEVKLSPRIFDDYFKNPIDMPGNMVGPDTVRVNTKRAWRMDVLDSENGVFYYFIQTKQGEIYLTYGYDQGDSYAASEDGSMIGWMFKLARTDIFSSSTVGVQQGSSGSVPTVSNQEMTEQDTAFVNQEYVLDRAIQEAILNQYKPESPDGLYHCADFVLLEQEEVCGVAPINSGRDNIELITIYGMALHESFGFSGAAFREVSYDYVPVKLQFQKESEQKYILKEAWFPERPLESWDAYQEAIWDTFSPYSEELANNVIYAIQDSIYLTSLRQNCYEQAVSFGAVDTDAVIEGLLEEVVASPGRFSSGVKDYIVTHEDVYEELIHYGKYTLWYCFGEFLKGGQTDLRGHVMASVCRDISIGWGEGLLIDSVYQETTGQEWFDAFRGNAEEVQKQYGEEEIKALYPASRLLLQLIGLVSD